MHQLARTDLIALVTATPDGAALLLAKRASWGYPTGLLKEADLKEDIGNWAGQAKDTLGNAWNTYAQPGLDKARDWASKGLVDAGANKAYGDLSQYVTKHPTIRHGLYGAGIGAGLGGLVGLGSGLFSRRRKSRALGDALTGALLGGTVGGGLGAAHGYMSQSAGDADREKRIQAAKQKKYVADEDLAEFEQKQKDPGYTPNNAALDEAKKTNLGRAADAFATPNARTAAAHSLLATGAADSFYSRAKQRAGQANLIQSNPANPNAKAIMGALGKDRVMPADVAQWEKLRGIMPKADTPLATPVGKLAPLATVPEIPAAKPIDAAGQWLAGHGVVKPPLAAHAVIPNAEPIAHGLPHLPGNPGMQMRGPGGIKANLKQLERFAEKGAPAKGLSAMMRVGGRYGTSPWIGNRLLAHGVPATAAALLANHLAPRTGLEHYQSILKQEAANANNQLNALQPQP